MTNPPPLPSHILHNLILFGRVLRGLGLEVNPGRMMEVVAALAYVEVWRRSDFYYTLRSFLVKKREDIAQFDEAFELFWQKPGKEGLDADLQDLLRFQRMGQQEKEQLVMPPPLQELTWPQEEATEADDEDIDLEIIEVTQTYSTREGLRQKDFGELTAVEFEQIKRLMTAMIWQLGQRQTRRLRAGKKGRGLDMRRTLRHNFRYGGDILEWKYREKKIKPRPIVILADVSGSMERYTRLLIHFLYGLHWGVSQQVEVFLFSTRLTRITRQLHHKDVDEAVREVTAVVNDWSGGTRIGDCLKTFNFAWSRRVLRHSAIVILISDGWDRGDPALLKQEMARLSRTCHRLVWLNPLLGSTEYEPLTRGMQAALPFIDDFLPVHNLASLEDLAQHLGQLDEARPSQRRRITLGGAAFVK